MYLLFNNLFFRNYHVLQIKYRVVFIKQLNLTYFSLF